jgi:hypothetical protein
MKVAAACHVHSNWSYDGSWTITELASEFSRRGYRVLMMTEHDRGFTADRLGQYRDACLQASSDKILVIPGIEYSDSSNTVHVLTWGEVPFLGEGVPTNEVLNAVKEAAGVAVLAHPARRDAWKSFDPAWGDSLLGIEVWNRKADGWSPSQRATSLLDATGAMPFVGMDFHERRQLFPLAMSLELEGSATEKSVLACFTARRCIPYAFGVALSFGALRAGMAALGPLESCRRSCAWIYRKVTAIRRRRLAHSTQV